MEDVMCFVFGKNWQFYSVYSLTPAHIEQSHRAFRNLINDIDLRGKKFIVIGYVFQRTDRLARS